MTQQIHLALKDNSTISSLEKLSWR